MRLFHFISSKDEIQKGISNWHVHVKFWQDLGEDIEISVGWWCTRGIWD